MINLIKRDRGVWLAVGVILAGVLFFEAAQQFYFVRRYELVTDPDFWMMFRSQCRRWFIWVLLVPVLVPVIKMVTGLSKTNKKSVWIIPLAVVICCLVSVSLVAFVEILRGEGEFSWGLYTSEYLTFFVYQKGPLYLLGYAAAAFVFYFKMETVKLKVDVLQLADVRDTNLALTQRLQELLPSESQVLAVRIGKRQKLIPLSEVVWIQADDYCAKLHTADGKTYSMRITLKALERKCGPRFARIHRSALVNVSEIVEIIHAPVPMVKMSNGHQAPLAKRRIQELTSQVTA